MLDQLEGVSRAVIHTQGGPGEWRFFGWNATGVGLKNYNLFFHHSDVEWCIMRRDQEKKRTGAKSHRISVTFNQEYYKDVRRIAQRKRVSVAWVVREAVEQYVEGEAPLFGQR